MPTKIRHLLTPSHRIKDSRHCLAYSGRLHMLIVIAFKVFPSIGQSSRARPER